jgi:hypothetical protein
MADFAEDLNWCTEVMRWGAVRGASKVTVSCAFGSGASADIFLPFDASVGLFSDAVSTLKGHAGRGQDHTDYVMWPCTRGRIFMKGCAPKEGSPEWPLETA